MIFQEIESEALAAFNTYMDPIVLIYTSIAVGLFIMFARSKSELRVFIITMIGLWFSIFFMAVALHDFEAIALMISGVASVFGILFYQQKTKVRSLGGK